MALEAAHYLGEPNASASARITGYLGAGAGALLVAGLLTPIAAAFGGIGVLLIAGSIVPGATPTLFDSRTTYVFALTMLLGVIGLGPGAYSVDSRVFGRREIIIPPMTSQSE